MKREDFYFGQRLVTPHRHKEEDPMCNDFVIVDYVYEEKNIVHYFLNLNDGLGGVLHSGMSFDDAEEYFE